MSTRGCVAIGTNEKDFTGVYNHFDSYPRGLGANVFEHLHGKGVERLKKFAEQLLKYDDWRNYLNEGKCEYCGQTGFGQPHSINGLICFRHLKEKGQKEPSKEELEIENNVKETDYPDPLAKWHEHGDLSEKMTPQNSDALFIEWVYIIVPEEQKMIALTHGRAAGEHEETSWDNKRKWMSPNYTWYFVCDIDLSVVAPEPNWEFVEATGNKISDEMYNRYEPKKEARKCRNLKLELMY